MQNNPLNTNKTGKLEFIHTWMNGKRIYFMKRHFFSIEKHQEKIDFLKFSITYIVKWKGCCISTFTNKSFNSNFAFLLFTKRGSGKDLVDHSGTLSPSEKGIQIVASKKSVINSSFNFVGTSF